MHHSFTLIELLVVIAIIGVLAAVIIASTGSARQQARDSRRTQDLNALKTALEFYYDDHRTYPQGNIGPDNSSSDSGFCIEKATGTNQFQSILTQGNYLSTIPKDPLYQDDITDPDFYCYWYQTKDNGQKFKLFAKTEMDNYEPAKKDGGLYTNYYEVYSINSGSNQIAFTNEGSGGEEGGFFICGVSTIQDDEGNIYPTVKIGTQCWLKKNMNIGTMIQGTSNQGTNCSTAASIKKYCYDNNSANCDTYGGLYQWNQAMCGTTTSLKGICPTGWHIPTDAEYKTLEVYLGCGTTDVNNTGSRCDGVGTKLKQNGSSGFEGLLAGYRTVNATFQWKEQHGAFWMGTQSSSDSAWARILNASDGKITRYTDKWIGGFSVRCLKD